MKMVNNALSIGKVMGIPIRLHISLLIVLPYIMTFFTTPNMFFRLLGAVGIFVSVALHELGHSVVAQAKGSYILEIVLYPFGGAAKIANIPKRPMDEILVALAGPAVSVLLGILGIAAGFVILTANPESNPGSLILELGAINAGLFIFNIFPVFPMDGGRVLRAILTRKKGRLAATRIAVTISKYFCLFFVIYGLLNMQLFLAFIGVYIYFAGKMEYRMVQMEYQEDHFSGFRAGKIDVEVSPPPYAEHTHKSADWIENLRSLFRR